MLDKKNEWQSIQFECDDRMLSSHRGGSAMQICSDDGEAFVRTSTLTATAGACLSPKGELRRSWSKKVRERSRKRSVERKLYARPACDGKKNAV